MSLDRFITKDDKILVVAPHADDEVLGCGGLLTQAKDLGAHIYIAFATLSGFNPLNGGSKSTFDERELELSSVMSALGVTAYDVLFKGEDKHLLLDTVPQRDLISWFEKNSQVSYWAVEPTLLLIPSREHNHQDHRATHDALLSVIRTNPTYKGDFHVLTYEIPGTGQGGYSPFAPHIYFALTQEDVDEKCRLFRLYASQNAQPGHLRNDKAIRTLASYRGLEAGIEFAEAFSLIRSRYSHAKRKI